MGLGLIGFAWSRWLPLSLPCLTLAGMGGVLLMASSNTVVQTLVDEDKRGRVMAIYSMAFTGTMPLGNLLAGFLAAASAHADDAAPAAPAAPPACPPADPGLIGVA